MKNNLSEIICVLDRSGSIATIRYDAIDGLNTFVESQRAEPGEARLALVLFDDQSTLCSAASPSSKWLL
jgi:hypothetical protein